VKHSDLLATNLLPCVEQFQIFIAEKILTSLKKDARCEVCVVGHNIVALAPVPADGCCEMYK